MKLEKIVIMESILDVIFETQKDMALTCLRPSEHYENPFFKGKVFTFEEFKDWYVRNSPEGKKTGKFTYAEDWDGFSLRSSNLEPFYGGRFDPLSDREEVLLRTLEKEKRPFYMIGSFGEMSTATRNHEISHGLFYTYPEYKAKVLEVVKNMPAKDRKKVQGFLASYGGGYHPDVWDEEMACYLLDRRCLRWYVDNSPMLKPASDEMKKIFRKFTAGLKGS